MQTVIIERWAILRYGLGVVVRQARRDTTVTDADTATEGIDAVRRVDPQLVIVGQVPDMEPTDVVTRIVAQSAGTKVVVLLDVADSATVRATLAAGADAVLSRAADADELTDVLVRVDRGERVLSSELVIVLADVTTDAEPRIDPDLTGAGLTRREGEILSHLSRGSSNRDIAGALFIGEATVKTHLAKIYDKLGVSSRHQAVARALELGVLNGGAGSRAAPAVQRSPQR
jgi:DNA-binding NarL/FixJ family response regulator